MRVELVSTGDELILGEIVDTNTAEMASALEGEGFTVSRVTVVGDERKEIASALSEALGRSDVVIATGGLGPTDDDLAREALSDVMGSPLETRPAAERAIEQRLGRPLLETDRKQAMAPRGAELIENRSGSAPGLRAAAGGSVVYLLPGVPHEMRDMFMESVLPEIVASGRRSPAARRHLVVYGMPEAEVGKRLRGLESEGGLDAARTRVGTCARAGVITVRIRSIGPTDEEAVRAAETKLSDARERLGDAVVGEGDRTLAESVAQVALAEGLTLAVAESCTGGLVTSSLVAVPGISAALIEGCVVYSNEAKVRRLGVPDGLIREKGAVSREVARAMAEGARRESGADVALAVTGIAGPGGATEAKDVGLVHMAAASDLGTESCERRIKGSRDVVRRRASEAALWLLLREARRLVAARTRR